MKILIGLPTLAMCSFLFGCGVKTVSVPVSSCPAPRALIMPELAISRLPKRPQTADTLKALAEDHIALKGSLEQCITILDGYRK